MMAPTTFTIQKYGKHIHNIASPVFHKLIDFHHVPPEPFFQLKKKKPNTKKWKEEYNKPLCTQAQLHHLSNWI